MLGGDKRDRTADLLHAMQALSQLSYTPPKSRKKTTRHSKQSKILAYFCAGAQIPYCTTLDSLFRTSSLPKTTNTESIAGVCVVANNAYLTGIARAGILI